jgi:hypothetical protein
MADGIKFWYPIRNTVQPALLDNTRNTIVEIPMMGHMEQSGYLLCAKNKAKLLEKLNTKNSVTVVTRKQGVDICPDCQKAYKENKWLARQKWVSPSGTETQDQSLSTEEK